MEFDSQFAQTVKSMVKSNSWFVIKSPTVLIHFKICSETSFGLHDGWVFEIFLAKELTQVNIFCNCLFALPPQPDDVVLVGQQEEVHAVEVLHLKDDILTY